MCLTDIVENSYEQLAHCSLVASIFAANDTLSALGHLRQATRYMVLAIGACFRRGEALAAALAYIDLFP